VETKDRRRIQRMGNRELSALLMQVINNGHRYKITKAGIIIYGPDGITGTHLANTDRRALRNFSASLRRCGITI
jgi:hypothetical protein